MTTNETQENCIIDCRVSDPQQLKGGSLDDQEVVGRNLASKNGWNVVKVFRKPHSATTTERDDMEEITSFIKNSKVRIHHYIFKCIDRFTRVGIVEYEHRKSNLEKLGVQICDTAGIIQPKRNTLEHLGGNLIYRWSFYSPSEGAEMLEAHKGKQEWRDIINRLIGEEIRLVQAGYCVRRAPDGLKNKYVFEENKERCVREEDKERVHYFRAMFEFRAMGLSDTENVARVNAMGFRTRVYKHWDRNDQEHPKVIGQRGNKPLTVKQLQRYIEQTEYAGVSYEKWTKHNPIRMKHFNGIVSVNTFNQANRGKIFIKENLDGSVGVLHNRIARANYRKNNPYYKYTFLPCYLCRSPMLGSAPRSKSGKPSPRYHCGNTPSRKHAYFSIPKKAYEEAIRNFLNSLKYEQQYVDSLELVLNDVYRTREKEIVSQSASISLSVGDLKTQQASFLETLTTTQSPVARKLLEEKIEKIQEEIEGAEIKRTEIEITERDIKSFVKSVKAIIEHPTKILMDIDDIQVQRTLFNLVFEELPTYQEIQNGTPKLSLAFKLSGKFKGNETQCVTLLLGFQNL